MTTPAPTELVAPSSSSSELSDYDSSSSLEVVINPMKLKDVLAKELEEERKAAAKVGGPTYKDGSALQVGSDGKVRSGRIVRLERIQRARKAMKAQVLRNVATHLQKPYVRAVYDFLRRDLPPPSDICGDLAKKKFYVSADEERISVQVERRPPPAYPY